jgi:hypothetical protein
MAGAGVGDGAGAGDGSPCFAAAFVKRTRSSSSWPGAAGALASLCVAAAVVIGGRALARFFTGGATARGAAFVARAECATGFDGSGSDGGSANGAGVVAGSACGADGGGTSACVVAVMSGADAVVVEDDDDGVRLLSTMATIAMAAMAMTTVAAIVVARRSDPRAGNVAISGSIGRVDRVNGPTGVLLPSARRFDVGKYGSATDSVA